MKPQDLGTALTVPQQPDSLNGSRAATQLISQEQAVALNEAVVNALAKANGDARPLFVDPNFRPAYLYASGEYWDWVGGRSPRLIPPAAVSDAVPLTWCPPTTLCEDAARCGAGGSVCKPMRKPKMR